MIKQLNHLCKGTFISFLGIEFLDYGDDFIEASMPVDNKLQPMGLLHGGASLALAETIASGGSYLLVDPEKYDVFGLQVSGNHISTISAGHALCPGRNYSQGTFNPCLGCKNQE